MITIIQYQLVGSNKKSRLAPWKKSVVLPISLQHLLSIAQGQYPSTIFLALSETPFIVVSIGSYQLTYPFWFFITELSAVDEAIKCWKDSFAMPETFHKLSLILCPVSPGINSSAFRDPLLKTSFVFVPVGPYLSSPSVFFEVEKISVILLCLISPCIP